MRVSRYSSETGRLLSDTCIGPKFYRKLTHMVEVLEDKIQSRAWVCVQTLTRQPTAFTRRGNLGEMERDYLISHGSALLLRERLMELSDLYDIYVCQRCGYVTQTKSYCKICHNKISAIAPVHGPCSIYLETPLQELMAMSIAPKWFDFVLFAPQL